VVPVVLGTLAHHSQCRTRKGCWSFRPVSLSRSARTNQAQPD